jgi:hypothetical protein
MEYGIGFERRTLKTILYTKGLPFRVFFEARRARVFLNLFVTGPPRGALFLGRRYSSYRMKRRVPILAS